MSTAGWTLDKARQIARFWTRTRINGACIEWTGATRNGYGRYRGKYAHRWIREAVCGPLPPGTETLHSCDNKRCVKLQHTEPGTHRQNVRETHDRGLANPARGTRNGNSSITDEMVSEIREARARGESQRSVARRLGVSQASVWSIANNKTRSK